MKVVAVVAVGAVGAGGPLGRDTADRARDHGHEAVMETLCRSTLNPSGVHLGRE